MKQNVRHPTVTPNNNPRQNPPIDYYKIPSEDIPIIFIDSMSEYDRLLNRLFNVHNEDEELFIGFDCMFSVLFGEKTKFVLIIIFCISGEWKPIYNNTATSKECLSIMQLAFSNEIYLLDALKFFHTCDSKTVQQRLANRLFDDDHLTVLCKSQDIYNIKF